MTPKSRPLAETDPLQQVDRVYVRIRGRRLVYFSGCDYFRLASHPKVMGAMQPCVERYGLNVAASRLTTGNHALYRQLESKLTKFFGADAAITVPTGYLADLVAAQALAGTCTHALLDDASHAALQEAAALVKAKVVRFRSRDPKALARAVHHCGTRARIVVLTDGMFARDGSVAPLAEYLKILPRSARLLVDDAHGAGVLGRKGQGSLEHSGVNRARIIQTLTLSKAFGVYGGVILGTPELRRRIVAHSNQFAGSTPLPLPLVCAALASLRLHSSGERMRRRLSENADYLKDILRSAGMDIPDFPGPIICILPQGAVHSNSLRSALLAAGIFPPFIRYPGGPANGFFRFVISSEHTRPHLNAVAAAVLKAHARCSGAIR